MINHFAKLKHRYETVFKLVVYLNSVQSTVINFS